MKFKIILFFLLTVSLLDAQTSQIKFENGDTLNGDIIEMRSNEIVFKHPIFKTENNLQSIDIKTISSISGLDKNKKENLLKGPFGNLKMSPMLDRNIRQDVYRGLVNTINDEFVTIGTSYAGEIKIYKRFIENLSIIDSSKLVLSTLGNLESWKITPRNANIKQDGKIFIFNSSQQNANSTSSISRELEMPKLSHTKIIFENGVNQNAYNLHFKIGLFTNEIADNYAKISSIYLIIQGNSIALSHRGPTGGTKVIATEQLQQNFNNLNIPFTLDIYVNTENKTVSVYNKGKKIFDEVEIPKLDNTKLGKHIFISSLRAQNRILLNHLSIEQWDGSKPPIPLESRIAMEKDQQIIHFRNGDVLAGHIDRIEEGVAYIQSPHGKFKVKLSNLVSLDLGNKKEEELKMEKNSSRLSFYDGSSFIVQIKRIENAKIIAESQAFEGAVAFDISALKSIEFETEIFGF